MSTMVQTRFVHKLFEPVPWKISEANTHCVTMFDKLRLQREQGRFCDVILKVLGREFPAHRCVLASCSSWFDTKLKVHKTLKENVEIENCQNYEVFHLVLTYMYTGQIVIDKHNVYDILDIAHHYIVTKLKNYCAEFLEKSLRAANCMKIIQMAEKYHLADLSKQTMAFIDKHFENIIQHHEIEKMNISDIQSYLTQRAWDLPSELIFRIITRWVSHDSSNREDNFLSLLHHVNWTSLDTGFIFHHLDTEQFYVTSPESLLTVLHVLDKNNIKVNQKLTDVYKDLQERLLPDQDFEQDLMTDNSFLSIAINSAVKDLDHSEVDESFSSYILQPDAAIGDSSQYGPYRHPSGTDDAYSSRQQASLNESQSTSELMSIDSYQPGPGEKEDPYKQVGEMSLPSDYKVSDDSLCSKGQPSCGQDGFPQSEHMFEPPSKEILSEESARTTPNPKSPDITSPSMQSSSTMSPSHKPDVNLEQYKSLNIDSDQQMQEQLCRVQGAGRSPDVPMNIYKPAQPSSEEFPLYRNEPARCQAQTQCMEPEIYRDELARADGNALSGPGLYRAVYEKSDNFSEDMYRNEEGTPYPAEGYKTASCSQLPQDSAYDTYRSSDSEMLRSETSSLANQYHSGFRQGETEIPVEESKTVQPIDEQMSRPDRVDRIQNKTDFDFSTEYQIVEQVINEHRMSEERSKYSSSTATKRYDPKHRALAEASRQMNSVQFPDQNANADPNFCSTKIPPLEFLSMKSNSVVNSMENDYINNPYKGRTAKEKSLPACQYYRQATVDSLAKSQMHHPDITITPVQDLISEEFLSSRNGQEDFSNKQESTDVLSTQPLSSSVSDSLQTPEKSEVLQYNSTSSKGSSQSKSNTKLDGYPQFLTPKEKYAKVLAEKNNADKVKRSLIHDSVKPPENQSNQQENVRVLSEEVYKIVENIDENKHKVPTAFRIIKAKKKMATQKKMILEHGEVKGISKPLKVKVKQPLRKRIGKVSSMSNSATDSVELESLSGESGKLDSNKVACVQERKIVNRKDKLLAEHRSQNQNLDDSHSFQLDSELYQGRLSQEPNSISGKGDKKSGLVQLSGEKGELYCDQCSYKSRSSYRLNAHKKTHEKESKETFLCQFCDEKFAWRKDYLQHIKDAHIPGPPFKCLKCEYRNSRIQQLLSHYSCHVSKSVHACSHAGCDYRGTSELNLAKHGRVHDDNRAGFACTVCGKSFGHKATLVQHQAVHTQVRKYKCGHCSFSTKYNSHLAAHKRTHQGNVHRCPVEDCQYWTPKYTLYQAHMRAHNGDRPFKCTTCPKAFVEAGQLKRHEKIHTSDKPFKCDIGDCSYATNRRDKLKEHQKRSHKSAVNEAKTSSPPKQKPPKFLLSLIPKNTMLDEPVLSPSEVPFVHEEVLGV